jgi:hypothetical protein
MNPHHTTSQPVRPGATPVAAALVGLTTVAALLTGTSSGASAATASGTCVQTATTTDYKPAVTRAKTALAKALTNVQRHHFNAAAGNLDVLRHQTRVAHTGATSLIGKPPTDPESDELPGVAAVQSVAGLEHSIAVKLVPGLKEVTRAATVRDLGNELDLAVACRDVMLAKVIALKPAARDDYTDGLADTLPGYDQELNAMTTALAGTGYTGPARTRIQTAQTTVTSTRTDMQRVFGGGERSPRMPR